MALAWAARSALAGSQPFERLIDCRADILAAEMIIYCPNSCQDGIRLFTAAASGASRRHPPVVQHVRDMNNLVVTRDFQAAQRQIVILASFEAFSEAAGFANQRRIEHAKMRKHVL